MCFKLNRQIVFLLLFLFLSTALSGQTGRYRYQFDVNKPSELITTQGNSMFINYCVSELNIEEVENESGLFYRINIPGHTPTYDVGEPEVPVFSRMIIIPDGADVRIKISEVKSVRLHPSSQNIRGILYPSQENESKSLIQRVKEFKINSELYNSKQLIPLDTVKIESIGRLRDNPISNIAIYPVRYNPNTNSIEVITSMKIEITNVLPINSQSLQNAGAFTRVLSSALNFSAEDVPPVYSDKPIGMVILTDTLFKKHIEPFVKWKTQKGFDVTVLYRGRNYAGVSYSQIKNTLETTYKSSAQPPDYLLIIGDTRIIPYYGGGNVTDLYYGEFSGNGDYIPEMFIGRLPVSDTTQLKNVIDKIIQYEKFQFAPNTDFYSRALAIGGNDGATSNNTNILSGHVYYAVNNYLNSSNNLTGYAFSYPQSSNPNIPNEIRRLTRQGLSFINYTGHGETNGWVEPNLRTGDLDTVSNTGMYPFIISNACHTSNFNLPLSFGNRMVLSSNKGAIGFIGASNTTYFHEDYYWAVGVGNISTQPVYSDTGLGVYDRLFHTHGESPSEWYYTMGQINFAGNLSVSTSTSVYRRHYWEVYNLVGDPSVIPIIGKPEPFKTQIPDELPANIKSITLVGEPFSYIAVSDFNTLWDASFVSASGAVELTFPDIKGDSCLFVITGQNKIPLIKTVKFSHGIDEYLNFEGYKINDINGNNNQLADYGERVYLAVEFENHGFSAASNVYAKISTSSDFITITKDSTFIGYIHDRSKIELTDVFEFIVRDDVEDKSIAAIELTLVSDKTVKKYIIDILIHAPKLQIVSCSIDNSVFGNENNIADPGARIQFVYKVRNFGSSDASGLFSVSIFDIDLGRDLSFTVSAGETIEIPIRAQVSSSAEIGSYFNLNSTLSYGVYTVQNTHEFRVGKVREDFNSESFDFFPWINSSASPWTITSGNVYAGHFSAQSGKIGDNSSSSLYISAVYSANDIIRFWYNVSSEKEWDFLSFKINGKEVLRESGETGWKQFSGQVESGLNIFEWSYDKDKNFSVGEDCAWIDIIDFTTAGLLKYVENDLAVARIVPPPASATYSMEPITVKLVNLGRETINGFTLAYTINGSAPVQQTFYETIVPSLTDTVTVEFFEKFDFYHFDRYNITVYAVNNNDDYSSNDTVNYMFIHELKEPLIIYPNPFIDRFTVFIYSQYSDVTTISMFDLSGKKVYETHVNVSVGQNSVIINTPWLPPAVYIVNIRTNRGTTSMRVIKARR